MELKIDISKAMSICLRNGIKVSPIPAGKNFKVQVEINGKVNVYPKEVHWREINNALSQTYKYHALKILDNAIQTKEDKKTVGPGKQTIHKQQTLGDI